MKIQGGVLKSLLNLHMRVLKATTPSRPCRKIPKLSIRSPLAHPFMSVFGGEELEGSSGPGAAPSPGLDIRCPAEFPSSGLDINIALIPVFAMFLSCRWICSTP